ncbi:MAG: M48 family metallopeptidase [Alphaproteobacteria bacterium]|nr:M48 family metallopeptidase [Alphaproteobacteria bacterium]
MNDALCQDKKITIRSSIRTTHLRLTVRPTGQVILTIPLFCSRRTALDFLNAHQDWIDRQLKERKPSLTFSNGMTLSVLGQKVTICHDEQQHGTEIHNGTLLVGGDPAFINRRVTDFIKRETTRYIEDKARKLALKTGKSIHRITLKDTTSRWGSCSARQNLNFCWRLGMAPLFVLDYIIAHEVAHLSEMNHGPKFWRLVSELCTSRAEAEIWLRRNGHILR